MPRKAQGVATHIVKFPKFSGRTIHDLQNYILKLKPQHLCLLDSLTETNKETIYFPSIELNEAQGQTLSYLQGNCWSPVVLARRVREINKHNSVAQLMNHLSRAKTSFTRTVRLDLVDSSATPAPESESEEEEEPSESSDVPHVQTYELPPMQGWVL